MISFKHDELRSRVLLSEDGLMPVEDLVGIGVVIVDVAILGEARFRGVEAGYHVEVEEVPNVQKAVPPMSGHVLFKDRQGFRVFKGNLKVGANEPPFDIVFHRRRKRTPLALVTSSCG